MGTMMEYVKIYKSAVPNASKTLARKVPLVITPIHICSEEYWTKLEELTGCEKPRNLPTPPRTVWIKLVELLGLGRAMSLLDFEALNYWDFGVNATERIAKADIIYIICGSKKYTCVIADIVKDPSGELGDLLGWHRQFGKPWTNICLMVVTSIKKLDSNEYRQLVNCCELISGSFYRYNALNPKPFYERCHCEGKNRMCYWCHGSGDILNSYFPWADIILGSTNNDDKLENGLPCHKCGKKYDELLQVNFRSPDWTWEHLCGRAGILTICTDCLIQVDFQCTSMN